MSKANFSEEFKHDAVRQITERGYAVAEVSQRLGVSPHSLYEWKKKFFLCVWETRVTTSPKR